MGAFKNPLFMHEFALRTKMNYYSLRLCQNLDVEEEKRIISEKEKIRNEMVSRDYVVEDYFEITQLVNSMIGLLVFPEQSAYEHLPEEKEEIDNHFHVLAQYINGQKGTYENDYIDDNTREREIDGPRNVLRHLRNAASHKEIGIFPENGKLKDGREVIQSIVFKDHKKDRKNRHIEYNFLLRLDVDDLEELLMEICDYILYCSR